MAYPFVALHAARAASAGARVACYNAASYGFNNNEKREFLQ